MAEDAPRDRSERIQALRSAWNVLAAAGCSAEAPLAALAGAKAPLDLLEREVREIVPEVPIDRLRAAIAERVVADRRGVLGGRLGSGELTSVSRYLSHGKRSDAGRGTAFVGTLGEAWFQLAPAQQEAAAHALVAALRKQGVREVMVYDDEQRLCIQALGEQPARLMR